MSDENKETQEEKETPPKVDPEKVTGLTEEQVQELLNKARSQEKDKLYPQIEELGTTVKNLQAAIKAEQEEKQRLEAEAKAKAESERKAKLTSEEALAEGLKKIEEQLASERQARAALEQKIEQDRRREALQAYRSRKIATAQGALIPELVRGDSEAEIDTTFEIAKARYTELVEQAKTAKADEVRKQMPGPANPDTAAQEEQELLNSIDNIEIDPKRYARDKDYRAEMDVKRASVMARLERLYAQASGVA